MLTPSRSSSSSDTSSGRFRDMYYVKNTIQKNHRSPFLEVMIGTSLIMDVKT